MKHFRIIIVFLFCALSCGGTAAKVAYRNLDAVMLFELDSLFALSDSQKNEARSMSAELMRWHRGEVLPLYVPLLKRAQERVLAGMGEKEYAELSDLTAAEVRRIADRIAPSAADFALTLSDPQLERFIVECGAFNQKAEKKVREKRTDPSGYRVGQMMRTLEHFYGSFSAEQKKRIAGVVLANDDMEHPELYLRYLRETQRGFAAAVRTKDRVLIREYIRGWICRDPSFLPLYYRADLEHAARVRGRIIAEVDRSIVLPENRRAGRDAFQEYIDAIRDLIRR